MALDLNETASQVQGMASLMKARQSGWSQKLRTALETLAAADAQVIEGKRRLSRVTWLVPGLIDDLRTRSDPGPLPSDFSVVSVDGSHIDVDRHLPARCYLINIGACVLTYGSQPNAHLFSRPKLYADEDDLALRDSAFKTREQHVEGPLLGVKRAVEELRGLVDLLKNTPDETPTLALMDGTLVLFGLADKDQPEYVRKALLEEGFLQAMEEVRELAQARPLALASYISLPRSPEVVNALRLKVCPYEPANCDLHCKTLDVGARPCDAVGGLMDRDLFSEVLSPGQRSGLFASTSSVVEKYYGEHQIHFFYVNVGEEMGRVEMPAWAASNPGLLDLAHSVIVDQCRRGQGYPVAIMEAHEQAVVTGADRQYFRELVEEVLSGERLPVYTSEKERSKRVKWL